MARGKVYLVGAGPGDPELMTLKAKRLLGEADVVLYDRLLSKKMLEGLGKDVELIDVGKSAGRHKLTQEEINQLLVQKASEGHTVVRLKGGDPYMFGRGGEEALALLEKGLHFELVPGVTSAIAAPELAGIPVTHRGIASSLTVVTGHEEPGKDSPLDWSALARLGGTLVVLMGVARLEENIAALISGGKDPKTPAAIVEKGGWPEQRLVAGTLQDIAVRARDAGVTPPAILVVGEVVELSDQLGLKKIAILRPESQAAESAALARDYGFLPVCAPAIALVERPLPPDLAERIGRADCVVFTSANGVEMAMKEEAIKAGLQGKAVAAIGPKTGRALEKHGFNPKTPGEFSSLGLEKMLRGQCRSVLLLRSAQGTKDLVTNLLAAGMAADEVQLYDVAPSKDHRLDDLIENAARIDVFAFTSASTARLLFERAREMGMEGSLVAALKAATVAVIGPPTSAELKRLGVHVDVMPERYTFIAMLQKLRRVG